MSFDPTKPVQQENGRAAYIVTTNSHVENFPIIAELADNHGGFSLAYFTSKGRGYARPLQLVNIPQKKDVWVNIYRHNIDGSLYYAGEYATPESADCGAAADRVGRIRMTLEEGRYDD